MRGNFLLGDTSPAILLDLGPAGGGVTVRGAISTSSCPAPIPLGDSLDVPGLEVLTSTEGQGTYSCSCCGCLISGSLIVEVCLEVCWSTRTNTFVRVPIPRGLVRKLEEGDRSLCWLPSESELPESRNSDASSLLWASVELTSSSAVCILGSRLGDASGDFILGFACQPFCFCGEIRESDRT